ncbi:SPFH domain-containing protein [Thermoproteota archaeon]
MPLINAIQWREVGEDELARRFPEVSLRYGSQLTVMENQWGVFFRDGKALDVFESGRHTITSKNIPILIDIVQGLGIIGDIFECEVIFINKSQARVNFGGRAYSAPSGQIQYQAEIGFFGYMIIKVDDPKLFVTEFFGNRQASDTDDVSRFLRGFVIERVMDSFAEYDIFSLVRNLNEITDKILSPINDDAKDIGIKVLDTLLEGVDIPEEARRFASGMGQQAMVMQYTRETAEVLPDGGGAAGAGIGAGLGFSLGQKMMNTSNQGTAQKVKMCPSCGAENQLGNQFCGNCGADMSPKKTVICNNCGSQVPEGNKFCGNCGKPMITENICKKCGSKNTLGDKFCSECGEKLT